MRDPPLALLPLQICFSNKMSTITKKAVSFYFEEKDDTAPVVDRLVGSLSLFLRHALCSSHGAMPCCQRVDVAPLFSYAQSGLATIASLSLSLSLSLFPSPFPFTLYFLCNCLCLCIYIFMCVCMCTTIHACLPPLHWDAAQESCCCLSGPAEEGCPRRHAADLLHGVQHHDLG